MNELYPLKFQPLFMEKIWGGQQLKTTLGMDYGDLPNCGEAWVISGVDGNQTLVKNGFLAGNELNELVEIYMGDLVGEENFEQFGNEFPLLIKFIDAADWLSIQVHPDDELAAKRNIGKGKTEMWYILGAQPGAQLISGFNQPVDAASYLNHLKNGTLKQILNVENVQVEDVFFMPAGRVHAIGPGTLLAEIQQTSDTTYRIYDWDRKDAQGNARQLHTDEALEAIDFSPVDQYKTNYRTISNGTASVLSCPQFTVNKVQIDQPMEKNLELMDSFVVYIGLEGNGLLQWGEEQLSIKAGEAVLVPAIINRIDFIPASVSLKLLEVYIV
ncbi:MAG: class I mannose-6-phosphate isomerase [Bacteroidales bacterium]|nr:class I mannose-6-phosphate isomerase [Bacteroidales bacterium]